MSLITTYDFFEVLPEHVTLLQHAKVTWYDAETGAPCIDPKRPYGVSDVVRHVLKLLNQIPSDYSGEIDETMRDRAWQLHLGTEIALQIFLYTGAMKPGVYKAQKYSGRWEPVL